MNMIPTRPSAWMSPDVKNEYLLQRMLNVLHVAGFVTWLRDSARPDQDMHILAVPLIRWRVGRRHLEAIYSILLVGTLELPQTETRISARCSSCLPARGWSSAVSFLRLMPVGGRKTRLVGQIMPVRRSHTWRRLPRRPIRLPARSILLGPSWKLLTRCAARYPGRSSVMLALFPLEWAPGKVAQGLSGWPSQQPMGAPGRSLPERDVYGSSFRPAAGPVRLSAPGRSTRAIFSIPTARRMVLIICLSSPRWMRKAMYTAVTNLVQHQPERKRLTIERALLLNLHDPSFWLVP